MLFCISILLGQCGNPLPAMDGHVGEGEASPETAKLLSAAQAEKFFNCAPLVAVRCRGYAEKSHAACCLRIVFIVSAAFQAAKPREKIKGI
jgi:hypothetical protein